MGDKFSQILLQNPELFLPQISINGGRLETNKSLGLNDFFIFEKYNYADLIEKY